MAHFCELSNFKKASPESHLAVRECITSARAVGMPSTIRYRKVWYVPYCTYVTLSYMHGMDTTTKSKDF